MSAYGTELAQPACASAAWGYPIRRPRPLWFGTSLDFKKRSHGFERDRARNGPLMLPTGPLQPTLPRGYGPTIHSAPGLAASGSETGSKATFAMRSASTAAARTIRKMVSRCLHEGACLRVAETAVPQKGRPVLAGDSGEERDQVGRCRGREGKSERHCEAGYRDAAHRQQIFDPCCHGLNSLSAVKWMPVSRGGHPLGSLSGNHGGKFFGAPFLMA